MPSRAPTSRRPPKSAPAPHPRAPSATPREPPRLRANPKSCPGGVRPAAAALTPASRSLPEPPLRASSPPAAGRRPHRARPEACPCSTGSDHVPRAAGEHPWRCPSAECRSVSTSPEDQVNPFVCRPLAGTCSRRSLRQNRTPLRAWDARALECVAREMPFALGVGRQATGTRGDAMPMPGLLGRVCTASPVLFTMAPLLPAGGRCSRSMGSHRVSSRRAADAAWPPVPRQPTVAGRPPRNAHHLEFPDGKASTGASSGDDVTFEAFFCRRAFRLGDASPRCRVHVLPWVFVPFEVFRVISPPLESGASPARPKPVRGWEPRFPIFGKSTARADLPRSQVCPR